MRQANRSFPRHNDPPASAHPAKPRDVFLVVFLSVLGLTVLSLVLGTFLATAVVQPSEEIKRLIETCSTTWKLGFGAIVGLIGGRAL